LYLDVRQKHWHPPAACGACWPPTSSHAPAAWTGTPPRHPLRSHAGRPALPGSPMRRPPTTQLALLAASHYENIHREPGLHMSATLCSARPPTVSFFLLQSIAIIPPLLAALHHDKSHRNWPAHSCRVLPCRASKLVYSGAQALCHHQAVDCLEHIRAKYQAVLQALCWAKGCTDTGKGSAVISSSSQNCPSQSCPQAHTVHHPAAWNTHLVGGQSRPAQRLRARCAPAWHAGPPQQRLGSLPPLSALLPPPSAHPTRPTVAQSAVVILLTERRPPARQLPSPWPAPVPARETSRR
jgi:hypothetical protein